MTTLRPQGNLQAQQVFEQFVARSSDVAPLAESTGPARRVLLTGFGLFKGLAVNSSGAIVTNISLHWPARVPVNEKVTLDPGLPLHNGIFPRGQGAQRFHRQLTIGNELIELRVLVLDVLWDIAGAIIVHEMEQFQPAAVVMLGGGGGPILENGALNIAKDMQGFEADGSGSEINFPAAPFILSSHEVGHELPMTWDNQALRQKLDPYLRAENLSLEAAPAARPGNTYLCNHVSYAALAAAQGHPLDLADNKIRLTPKIHSPPKIGFFHLPWDLPLEKQTIEKWGSLVTSLISFV